MSCPVLFRLVFLFRRRSIRLFTSNAHRPPAPVPPLSCSPRAAPQRRDSNAPPPLPLPTVHPAPPTPLKRSGPTQSTIQRHHQNVDMAHRKSAGGSAVDLTGAGVLRRTTARAISGRRRSGAAPGERTSRRGARRPSGCQKTGVAGSSAPPRCVSRGALEVPGRATGRGQPKDGNVRALRRRWERGRCGLRRSTG